ncbi:hypothetical protein ACIO13_23745 [Streptomyces sp. NPDC087425]|uniref:hypothetical protein n=1 Tax=Streptomyces sp. NPDC087425 TaxID=3365787 RepID=UPI003828E07A
MKQKSVPAQFRSKRVAAFHAEYKAITSRTPMKVERVVPLLHELAGADPSDGLPTAKLYKTAAAAWHPDRAGGDQQVFQLLQEANRLARLHEL